VKLAALFSGGKDSTYAVFAAREQGHQISCLVTLHPPRDDSLLFHYPNSWITRLQSEAMQIPLLESKVKSSSKEDEIAALDGTLAMAKSRYGIDGVLSGGISSKFQKEIFDKVSSSHNMFHISPNWGSGAIEYMNGLLDKGFTVMLVGVSAMGLGKEWLGTIIDRQSLAKLQALSKKYGFNLNFEGGEAETLVLDCPLFFRRVVVIQAISHWDGQRGIFEIQEAALEDK
jgi:ABC transporter with metal-binding/Fe-S-binding domain ATP-binding protein